MIHREKNERAVLELTKCFAVFQIISQRSSIYLLNYFNNIEVGIYIAKYT